MQDLRKEDSDTKASRKEKFTFKKFKGVRLQKDRLAKIKNKIHDRYLKEKKSLSISKVT